MNELENKVALVQELHDAYVSEMHTLEEHDRQIVQAFLDKVREKKIAELRGHLINPEN